MRGSSGGSTSWRWRGVTGALALAPVDPEAVVAIVGAARATFTTLDQRLDAAGLLDEHA